ncbi:Synaptonemal complex protein 2 [Acipenser ruthenus]|uniref:Synaptonemal complex protein 2 n=1 Tax=Acipenser ruthenus TaxID=7906 RepID=A0A444UWH2_ACIRT|nr:Synaptonemal complex protein 2 [Acipenser ruthenus]
MTTGKQRQELADQWFTMEFVANAFKGIKDSEFETLLMPADDKLQDFWIDFNVGSQSITFYISPDDNEEETQWETVCLPEDEVEKYLVEEKDGNNLLKVSMKHPLNVSGKEGSQIQIYFSAALNIAEAIRNVYGAIKAKVSFTALSFWGRQKYLSHILTVYCIHICIHIYAGLYLCIILFNMLIVYLYNTYLHIVLLFS